MGLTSESTGRKSLDSFSIEKKSEDEKIIALAGNPNVGKSTVFNALTGLKQHTGNWPGKTVTNAQGTVMYNGKSYILVDIPGTYSLMPHSREEEVARDFICFGGADAVIVVCDATCLERNLNLVLQTIEITDKVIVCVNLMDEAKKKGIKIDLKALSKTLGVPVVGTSARSKKGLDRLMTAAENILNKKPPGTPFKIRYTKPIEEALKKITPAVEEKLSESKINSRWIALRLMENDESLINLINKMLHIKRLFLNYLLSQNF